MGQVDKENMTSSKPSKPATSKAQKPKKPSVAKVVMRRLPPSLTEEDFLEQTKPLPEHDSFYFVPADLSSSMGGNCFSRAYIAFRAGKEIIDFRNKWDGYVFLDEHGQEFPAVVEFAPFQKMPRKKPKKADNKSGTLDQDADFLSFVETMDQEETVELPSLDSTVEELEKRDRELRAHNGVPQVITPLIEFVLSNRPAERARVRDDRRERDDLRFKKKLKDVADRRKYIQDERRRGIRDPTTKSFHNHAIPEESDEDTAVASDDEWSGQLDSLPADQYHDIAKDREKGLEDSSVPADDLHDNCDTHNKTAIESGESRTLNDKSEVPEKSFYRDRINVRRGRGSYRGDFAGKHSYQTARLTYASDFDSYNNSGGRSEFDEGGSSVGNIGRYRGGRAREYIRDDQRYGKYYDADDAHYSVTRGNFKNKVSSRRQYNHTYEDSAFVKADENKAYGYDRRDRYARDDRERERDSREWPAGARFYRGKPDYHKPYFERDTDHFMGKDFGPNYEQRQTHSQRGDQRRGSQDRLGFHNRTDRDERYRADERGIKDDKYYREERYNKEDNRHKMEHEEWHRREKDNRSRTDAPASPESRLKKDDVQAVIEDDRADQIDHANRKEGYRYSRVKNDDRGYDRGEIRNSKGQQRSKLSSVGGGPRDTLQAPKKEPVKPVSKRYSDTRPCVLGRQQASVSPEQETGTNSDVVTEEKTNTACGSEKDARKTSFNRNNIKLENSARAFATSQADDSLAEVVEKPTPPAVASGSRKVRNKDRPALEIYKPGSRRRGIAHGTDGNSKAFPANADT